MALSSTAACGSNSYSQLLLSSDYGVTWSKTTTGLPNICNGYYKVVYSQDLGNMYAIPVVVVGNIYNKIMIIIIILITKITNKLTKQ